MIVPTSISEYRKKDYFIHYMKLQVGDFRIICTWEEGILVEKSIRITTEFRDTENRLVGLDDKPCGKLLFYDLNCNAPDDFKYLVDTSHPNEYLYFEIYSLNQRALPMLYAYYYDIIKF